MNTSGEKLGSYFHSAYLTREYGELVLQADYTDNLVKLENGLHGIIRFVSNGERVAKVFYPIDSSDTVHGHLFVDL